MGGLWGRSCSGVHQHFPEWWLGRRTGLPAVPKWTFLKTTMLKYFYCLHVMDTSSFICVVQLSGYFLTDGVTTIKWEENTLLISTGPRYAHLSWWRNPLMRPSSTSGTTDSFEPYYTSSQSGFIPRKKGWRTHWVTQQLNPGVSEFSYWGV